jgi:phospholipase/carboxylesterase
MLHYQVRLPIDLHDNAPWLVLLHGRGADEEDLLALADFFPDHLVVAPRAPYASRQWDYGSGFAWYQHLGGATPHPAHFERSQQELHDLLEALPALLDFRPGPLFLGGFSQGGTMSLGYALRNPGKVHTAINLSGFLPEHPGIRVTPETVTDTYFYWAHGIYDAVVPHLMAQRGRAQLLAANACMTAPDLPIDHAVSRDEIIDIQMLLELCQHPPHQA